MEMVDSLSLHRSKLSSHLESFKEKIERLEIMKNVGNFDQQRFDQSFERKSVVKFCAALGYLSLEIYARYKY